MAFLRWIAVVSMLVAVLQVHTRSTDGSAPTKWMFTNMVEYEKEVANELQNLQDTGCDCKGWQCGCCAHIEIDRIALNSSVCVNLTYLPNDYGMSFTVTIGNRTLFNETISARSPPPLCAGVPYLKEFGEICIRFYNLNATLHSLSGCVDLEAQVSHVVVGEYDIGCFNIGSASKKNLDKYRYNMIN